MVWLWTKVITSLANHSVTKLSERIIYKDMSTYYILLWIQINPDSLMLSSIITKLGELIFCPVSLNTVLFSSRFSYTIQRQFQLRCQVILTSRDANYFLSVFQLLGHNSQNCPLIGNYVSPVISVLQRPQLTNQ